MIPGSYAMSSLWGWSCTASTGCFKTGARNISQQENRPLTPSGKQAFNNQPACIYVVCFIVSRKQAFNNLVYR